MTYVAIRCRAPFGVRRGYLPYHARITPQITRVTTRDATRHHTRSRRAPPRLSTVPCARARPPHERVLRTSASCHTGKTRQTSRDSFHNSFHTFRKNRRVRDNCNLTRPPFLGVRRALAAGFSYKRSTRPNKWGLQYWSVFGCTPKGVWLKDVCLHARC